MNKNYQLVSELLSSLDQGVHINIDMLIQKPCLYVYIPREQLEEAKTTGIKADDRGMIHAYFTRIPETVNTYNDYLHSHTPLKVMISKLSKVKDQKILIKPVNISIDNKETLTEDDIKKIAKKNRYFFKFFVSGKSLSDMPHAVIIPEKGCLPAFTYKIITPKIQTL